MNLVLCNHTGSFNRGCDAIVKSTADLFAEIGIDTVLAEHKRKEDGKYGIDEFSQVIDYIEFSNAPFRRSLSILYGRVLKDEYKAARIRQAPIWNYLLNNASLNVGGDTYCYRREDRLPSMMLNMFCYENKIPIVFWGCSIEDSVMIDPEVWDDLCRYSIICPRESLTYSTLLRHGYPKDRLFLMSDPAFTLTPTEVELPPNMEIGNSVCINISPLVIEKSNSDDKIYDNIYRVIDYVLGNTNMSIVLLPHVYEVGRYDYEDLNPLSIIKNKYFNDTRVILIDTFYNSKQLKYIISCCRFVITARTHVSIAAYSSFVPTLVLGYSIKSRGIAKDLFGEEDSYVIPVQEINQSDVIFDAFLRLMKDEDLIHDRLQCAVPMCIQRINNTVHFIENNIINHPSRTVHRK